MPSVSAYKLSGGSHLPPEKWDCNHFSRSAGHISVKLNFGANLDSWALSGSSDMLTVGMTFGADRDLRLVSRAEFKAFYTAITSLTPTGSAPSKTGFFYHTIWQKAEGAILAGRLV